MSDHIAAWKDMCIDAVDPMTLGRFWADTLGLDLLAEPGYERLVGPTPGHTIWMNQVTEPVTVKQRVHLDVHAGSVEEVLARGATPLDVDSFRWKVLRDPEGGELCVFVRDEVPEQRLYEIIVQTSDPVRLAEWWAGVIGGRWEDDKDGSGSIEQIPGAPFEYMVFVPVPEPKTVKNRIHWDIDVPDVRLLTERGATVLREPDDEISWTVMADPQGNEFCAFVES